MRATGRLKPGLHTISGCALIWYFSGFLVLTPGLLEAAQVILHLKNGDRISGEVVSESTTDFTIVTAWGGQLRIPASEVLKREVLAGGPAGAAAAPRGSTNAATLGSTNIPGLVITDAPPKVKHWKGEVRLGADFLLGAKDQEIFSGRLKLTYQRPYSSSAKEGFRNTFEYGLDYGRTEGVLSANRMQASDKFDLDIGKEFFVYNLGEIGYDEIRKIDLQYLVGPGIGYRLFRETNFLVNLEMGVSYQVQKRSDETTRDVFPRLAQDMTWKPGKKLTFTEKVEFFPRVDLEEFRARAELGVSYGFWQNLSLNLNLLDIYDSDPAEGVPNNDLQIRSSLGILF